MGCCLFGDTRIKESSQLSRIPTNPRIICSFSTMTKEIDTVCNYSGLPGPLAYVEGDAKPDLPGSVELIPSIIDRIIEMAWEDRTPFDAIFRQFGLREDEVKAIMKKNLRLKSYQNWRKRVENCKTKHLKKRVNDIVRFKCSRQRTISLNKISKRK